MPLHPIVRASLGALLIWLVSLPHAAEAGTLIGQVKGSRGEPKKHVRVEILGVESRTVFTDAGGRFTVDLPGGDYVITVQERSRYNRFSVTVPDSGETESTLPVNW